MNERKAVVRATAERYRRSGKKEKGKILDEFTLLTGHNRSYARFVLRNTGRKVHAAGKKFIAGKQAIERRGRSKIYGKEELTALTRIWKIYDYLCGKRLAPVMAEAVEVLERFGEIRLGAATREKLKHISASTIDRMLAPERRRHELKGRGHTRPGTLLKKQIPVRTFSEWDDARPGFTEIDLVAHEGGNSSGEFLFTLVATDIATGWTEVRAVRNKAQVWVFEALQEIRKALPVDLLGIDSDNGGEFINDHLYRYCLAEEITFTRSRPYRKNDNCFVEQKNYTVVRRHVGYQRLDTDGELAMLNELYAPLRLYVNFFQPVMKLASKERFGSKVTKKHDRAKTPYLRLLESPDVPEERKQPLRELYETLNPAALMRTIERLRNKLLKSAAAKRTETRRRSPTPWEQTNKKLFNKNPRVDLL